MSVSKEVKKYGFNSVPEVVELTKVKQRTLYVWYNNKPELFEILLLGAQAKKALNIK